MVAARRPLSFSLFVSLRVNNYDDAQTPDIVEYAKTLLLVTRMALQPT
jgi:hypothetical protein